MMKLVLDKVTRHFVWVLYGDWAWLSFPSTSSLSLAREMLGMGAIGCSGYGVYGADMGYMGPCTPCIPDVYMASSSGYMGQLRAWGLLESGRYIVIGPGTVSPSYPSSQSPPWSQDIPPSPRGIRAQSIHFFHSLVLVPRYLVHFEDLIQRLHYWWFLHLALWEVLEEVVLHQRLLDQRPRAEVFAVLCHLRTKSSRVYRTHNGADLWWKLRRWW